MGRLRILAPGSSPQAQAQARGKLFEKLMAQVLRHYGYKIDAPPTVNYTAMEIDIEGRDIVTGIPLYAECKCCETDVDAPKFQAFCGKYWSRLRKDQRCQGLFITLPGVNSHVKGLYREDFEQATDATVRLLEEQQVVDAIVGTEEVARPEAIAQAIRPDMGTAGDWLLLYTEYGLFWAQYIVPPGAGIPSRVALFDAKGRALSSRATIDHLVRLHPELEDFERIEVSDAAALPSQPARPQPEEEQIVEVRGSSAWFEYQFPASPQYFVGREEALTEIDSFAAQVNEKQTSSRGLLFEANSGWGKSSLVLAASARLAGKGHVAVAIDSRSASSSQFILRVADFVVGKAGDFDTQPHRPIRGFEDAASSLLQIASELEGSGRILFVFLDQFENIFFLPETLKRIRDTFLKLCDAQANVVMGFSWKSDLIGLTSEFPYQVRDALSGSSKHIRLDTFSEVETNEVLDQLAEELHSSLRRDLRFLLSEFSQGWPWLLTKLCAHVKGQREAGVLQADIANNLLNVEQLFQEDLRGLSAEEDETLRRIANAAPISVSDLGEDFKPDVIQALVHRRLLVRIGSKYDLYWDIFRDYLNSGRVPVQENYVLRTQPGSVLRALKLLGEAGGSLSVPQFRSQAQLTEGSLYNVARDMRLLGFAKIDDGLVTVQANLSFEGQQLDDAARAYLRDRLQRNRLVQRLMAKLDTDGLVAAEGGSSLLAESCPYMEATPRTWRRYWRIFAGWLDLADLGTYDGKDGTLSHYSPGRELRERPIPLTRRRARIPVPSVQSKPIEEALMRIHKAISTTGRIDWSGFTKSTRQKALLSLEDLGFTRRKKASIEVNLTALFAFVGQPESRPSSFAERALKMRSFGTFVEILEERKETGASLAGLGTELRNRLDVDWKDSTAEANAKIMLDWARYAGLAPASFARGKRRQPNQQPNHGERMRQGRLWK